MIDTKQNHSIWAMCVLTSVVSGSSDKQVLGRGHVINKLTDARLSQTDGQRLPSLRVLQGA